MLNSILTTADLLLWQNWCACLKFVPGRKTIIEIVDVWVLYMCILIILLKLDANTKKAHDATCLHCTKLKLAPKIILLSIYDEVHDCIILFALTLLTDNHHLARYSNSTLAHNIQAK